MNKRDPHTGHKHISRRASRFTGFPNLNHLYYFHAVALEGSLKQASAVLGVTQPTISAQVKSLEEFVGVRLFRREVGGMALSAAGQRMFEQTSVMFRATNKLLDAFAQDDLRGVPAVEVAACSSVSHVLGPTPFLALFRPGGFVRLRHGDHLSLLRDLMAREVDILLTDTQPDLSDGRLTSRSVYQPKLIAVCSASKPRSEVFPRNLDSSEFFHYTVGCRFRWKIDQFFDAHGVVPTVVAESDNAAIMLAAAEHGSCAAIVSESMAAGAVGAQRVQVLGQLAGVQADVFALYAKPAGQGILELIESLCSDLDLAKVPARRAARGTSAS